MVILPQHHRFVRSTRLRRPIVLGIASTVLLLASGLWSLAASPAEQEIDAQTEQLFFEDKVAAILSERCHACHNPDDHEGQLDLTSPTGLLKGSPSGAIITAGDRKHSLLYEVVHELEMPPDGDHLSDEEIQQIGDWIAAGAHFREPPELAAKPPSQHDLIPILLLRCTACHGAQLQRGDLDLRTLAGLRTGGQSGPAAVPGDPDSSLMIQRVQQQLCPPKGELLKYFVERPSTTEVDKMRQWIAAGMPEDDDSSGLIADLPDPQVTDRDRQHWSFQPLPRHIDVPHFDGVELAQPIDAFIYQRLQEQGLDFSPPAERTELIRRVHLNLHGLPPTLEELQRWELHSGVDWYEQMVESLLASPRYGERWGRYWLDVAGYADSEGGQSEDNVRQFAWKYRDYVIRAFNDDKPWDRFLMEQLAGDELADYTAAEHVTEEIVDNLIATGFLRMTVDETGSRTMNFVSERLRLIADTLNIVSSGVMGLTMECGRCHAHKYDPIPHSDYYRFKSIFQGAFDEHDWMSWKTRTLDVATPDMIAQREAVNTALQQQIDALESPRKATLKAWQDRYYEQNWAKLAEELQQEIQDALKARAGRRTVRQTELVARYESEIKPTEAVLVKKHPELAAELKQIDDRIAQLRQRLLPPLTIRALWDRGRPSPTYVLIRGEHNRPGRPVGPGVPSVLTDGKTPLAIQPPWPGAPSSGRRLAFAKWVTAPDHPLTARVLVNRMWSHHFGRGIVKTLDNFGAQGAEPTHPELLDWLARHWIQRDWSLKSLHRTILLSRTYRQSSVLSPERDSIDPENRLLSRMTLRRIDAEALRDSVLAVSGRLDSRLHGPPSPVSVREDGLIMERQSPSGAFRRSVYLQLRRTEMPTLLSAFDYPEMQPNCHERVTATVSTQSLILMNNQRIHELAGAFAEEVMRRSGGDPSEWVSTAYRVAWSRSPTLVEQSEGIEALAQLQQMWLQSGAAEQSADRLALTTFCHTLLNSAEFLYVD